MRHHSTTQPNRIDRFDPQRLSTQLYLLFSHGRMQN